MSNPSLYVNTGPRIRYFRKRAGYSQESLAEKLECTRSNVAQIERRKDGAKVETLQKCADAFGITLDDFLAANIPTPKKFTMNPNVKLLLQCCFLAIGIVALVWLSVNNIAWVRTAVNKPSAEFTAIHALYPRHWEPLASWDCYRKLRQSDKALLPDAIQNYKRRVLAQRKKWGSYVPAFKNDKTFFCGNVWRNFVQGEME